MTGNQVGYKIKIKKLRTSRGIGHKTKTSLRTNTSERRTDKMEQIRCMMMTYCTHHHDQHAYMQY